MRVTCAVLLSIVAVSGGETYFPNHVVRSHSGERLRFYQDLIADKTVVFHSFFAHCNGACPIMLGKMKALQQSLGDRLGQSVVLIRMTVDPESDTPERLAELALGLGAKPGWHLVSGRKENIDWILYKLGQTVEKPEEHKTIFIIGNDKTGNWTKLPAAANAAELEAAVNAVALAGRQESK